MVVQLTMEDKRRFTRIVFSAPATLCVDNKNYATTLVDVSLKGALVARVADEFGAETSKTKPCQLTFKLIGSEVEIVLEGHIAHVEDAYFGITCDKIDIQSASHLKRLVELNVGNAELLDRNLDSLTLPENS